MNEFMNQFMTDEGVFVGTIFFSFLGVLFIIAAIRGDLK